MKQLLFLGLLATSLPVLADDPPQKIDVSKLPNQAKMVEDVVVPVPSEIFGVLDKLGKPHWHEVLRPTKKSIDQPAQPSHKALLLGAIVAEGFIAVEAENGEEVKKIGRHVLNLATALGVKKWVEERSKSILDAADAKDWAGVRRELGGAMDKAKEGMIELNSGELSQLVSLGGWLRGTEALTEVVKARYTKDGAELLNQPLLIEHFERQIKALSTRHRTQPIVVQVQKGLADIKPLIALAGGAEISEKTVKEVNEHSARLVKTINGKAN